MEKRDVLFLLADLLLTDKGVMVAWKINWLRPLRKEHDEAHGKRQNRQLQKKHTF